MKRPHKNREAASCALLVFNSASGAVSFDSYAVCLQTWDCSRSVQLLPRDITAFQYADCSSVLRSSPHLFSNSVAKRSMRSMRDSELVTNGTDNEGQLLLGHVSQRTQEV